MVEQIAILRENLDGGLAVVVTDRKGACSGCQSGGGCHSCLSAAAKLESRAANPINAQAGDVVKISLSVSDLIKGALILYLLPVACLIAAAVIGGRMAEGLGWSETTGAVLAAGVGLVAGEGFVMLLDRGRYVGRHMMPTITSLLHRASGGPESKQPSCCR